MPKSHSEESAPVFNAYVSEPITRCPVREKGRIQTLVSKIEKELAKPSLSTKLYIPSFVTAPEVRSQMSPQHVYLLDRIRIVEADYVLVVADHTSFGIGGEVEMATTLGKPVIIFSRDEKVSRFLLGTPVNAVREFSGKDFIRYRDWRDLKPQLVPIIENIIQKLTRDEAESLPHWDVGMRLKKLRREKGLSQQELAHLAGIQAELIVLWEKNIDEIREEFRNYHQDEGLELGPIQLSPRRLEQLSNPGLAALHRLAFALRVPVDELLGESPKPLPLKGPAKLAEMQRQHLRESRMEHFEHLAAKFDMTFREYRELRTLLVDDALKTASPIDRSLGVITEREVLEALNQQRGIRTK